MYSKKEIRSNIKNIFKDYSKKDLEEKENILINKILSNQIVLKSKTIWLFFWIKYEINTKKLIDELLKIWKKVFLPKIINDDEIIFCKIKNLNDLVIWKYNILEPKNESEEKNTETFLVPWLAFSKDWKRIWKGKWYYDKYFFKNKDNYKIWVCFDFQIVDEFEAWEFDINMNEIIY